MRCAKARGGACFLPVQRPWGPCNKQAWPAHACGHGLRLRREKGYTYEWQARPWRTTAPEATNGAVPTWAGTLADEAPLWPRLVVRRPAARQTRRATGKDGGDSWGCAWAADLQNPMPPWPSADAGLSWRALCANSLCVCGGSWSAPWGQKAAHGLNGGAGPHRWRLHWIKSALLSVIGH